MEQTNRHATAPEPKRPDSSMDEQPLGQPEEGERPARPSRPSLALPVVLFLLTCVSTYLLHGAIYAVALIGILLCHELGHYVQARRYGVTATYPLFLPMPLSLTGTLGAVILIRSSIPHRRALFDIGVTGPLVGLVPAVACSLVGLHLSELRTAQELSVSLERRADEWGVELGESLLFRGLVWLVFGEKGTADDTLLFLHPLGLAGWVGIFITALNLIPIGQLDGGHILYALLRRRAVVVGWLLIVVGFVLVVTFQRWAWLIFLMAALLVGPGHPPTPNDELPIGRTRVIVGCLSFLLAVAGFTPDPFEVKWFWSLVEPGAS
jgi:membrane-associated protease RseP (regulator of RpoE activity)